MLENCQSLQQHWGGVSDVIMNSLVIPSSFKMNKNCGLTMLTAMASIRPIQEMESSKILFKKSSLYASYLFLAKKKRQDFPYRFFVKCKIH